MASEQDKKLSPERIRQLLKRCFEFYCQQRDKGPELPIVPGIEYGYCDGSLAGTLPSRGDIPVDLKTLEILDKSGSEYFTGCSIFPLSDQHGELVNICGFDIELKQHKTLPDLPNGIFNVKAVSVYPELILVPEIIDVLTLNNQNIFNGIFIPGDYELSSDLLEFFKLKTEKLKVIMTSSESVTSTDQVSSEINVEIYNLPEGYLNVTDFITQKGIQAFIDLPASVLKHKMNKSIPYERIENGFSVTYGMRRYEIMNLTAKGQQLKATLKLIYSGKMYVDTIDFYKAKMRQQLCQGICLCFDELPQVITDDIDKLIKVCEYIIRNKITFSANSNDVESQTVEISPEAEKDARIFGKSEDLIECILADFTACGLVGEESNKLLCYLVMTSRKMPEPLCVLTLSSSGAGKSKLQDTVLSFCPPEDLIKLTSLTGKALFYKDRKSLVNKVLALEEDVGAEAASYALRNLISSNSLISESTVRDPGTGKLTTMRHEVETRTAVFCTSTNPQIDPETRSRFYVIGIDESDKQTRDILNFQMKRYTLDAFCADKDKAAIIEKHRNFQRLLIDVNVINPFPVKFNDNRLQARRIFPQVLGLINSIAFLRQMQKPLKQNSDKGYSYIEVDKTDINLALDLAREILGKSITELSIPAQNLLEFLDNYLTEKLNLLRKEYDNPELSAAELTFTRKEIREKNGWSVGRFHTYLKELMDYEYVVLKSGKRNMLQHYQLVYDSNGLFAGVNDIRNLIKVQDCSAVF